MVVHGGARVPKEAKQEADRSSVRTSVSLPQKSYREVERIAQRNRVSIAWVIREAVEQYVTEEAPLLRPRPRE
jgi:metal-responsive CopG/Arc/MetJ family transcriptional regulator